ncbi:hypothetical protein [Jannaschia formosa]|uniref:hypothetical protein n=1 Tax=Jannaschia formosa TaxID=2259592 RepID=UPI000E1BCE7E|nr:hypothetical protein [Jannaschia formosa]TFL17795.1 hypothetical protein DR046_12915 [Jannaschia formosa]
MTDLIDGLGGPRGFGEDRLISSFRGGEAVDITSVFPNGLRMFSEAYDTVYVTPEGHVLLTENYSGYPGGERIDPSDPAGFYLYWAEHDPRFRISEAPPTPGGTSTGSGQIGWDLDPDGGAFTVTYDDVGPAHYDNYPKNAYQLRFLDVSDEPGAAPGDFRVEYRYEEVRWATDGLDYDASFYSDDPFGGGAAGFTFGDRGGPFFNIPGTETAAGRRDLPDAGVLAFTFEADRVTSNLPGQEVILTSAPPILGTPASDTLFGTDNPDRIEPGAGQDFVFPGLGGDRILSWTDGSVTTIVGTPEEHFFDEIYMNFDDVLVFKGVSFGQENVVWTFGFFFGLSGWGVDIDGDGVRDGQFSTYEYGAGSMLTATARNGTYVGFVPDLPTDGRDQEQNRWSGTRTTEEYLRGDGHADFELTLRKVSTTTEDGTVLGYYTYDETGAISDARILTADAVEAFGSLFLIDDVGRGESIGIFVMRPDEESALDDVDSFTSWTRRGSGRISTMAARSSPRSAERSSPASSSTPRRRG